MEATTILTRGATDGLNQTDALQASHFVLYQALSLFGTA
jgi:hypothetical protein